VPGGKIELIGLTNLQNDGTGQSLSQGTPVHAYLAPDALRVLTGEGRAAVDAGDALQVTGPPVSA
jgi:hypothetical protein